MKEIRKVLTIAGSDSSGGAGVQADLKTMLANGVYGMSAITALTAQNTQGVRMVEEASPEFLAAELDAVFEDIRPDAVKIGMVSSPQLIKVIAAKLREYQAEHVVVDPVMVATSGSKLLADEAIAVLQQELFPLAEVITPNIPELAVLTGENVDDEASFTKAARKLQNAVKVNVLAKGGHAVGDASDLLVMADGSEKWYRGTRVENPNTHGTGCTLSSAIAANLAKGFDLIESVGRAKSYLFGALLAQMDLGKGSGPVDHGWNLHGDFFEN
ncbi:bifunctional hydroxymethylpyrimidine kinase/phosphomethylpyrimidine kinase [Mitsuokella sp.]|uniref:bifunctional hydroxymethylpyrimidine kinase/phosphomethylpyrimidine kinase n=1 Tax=Mitsuokella sp. TaxID=2049034 RepID=UPI003D7DF73B